MAHRAFENDIDALSQLREMIDFLPLSNRDPVPKRTTADPMYVSAINSSTCIYNYCIYSDRDISALNYIIPPSSDVPYDMLDVVRTVVDEHEFFQIMPDYARNIVVGFARLDGRTVGIVGNQPNHKAGKSEHVCVHVVMHV